jgi:hypothetical protein
MTIQSLQELINRIEGMLAEGDSLSNVSLSIQNLNPETGEYEPCKRVHIEYSVSKQILTFYLENQYGIHLV